MALFGDDYGDSSGGLGGLGGGMNNFLTNPLTLAALQMLSNNTPKINQIPDTFNGVPQILFQSGQAKQKQMEREREQAKELQAQQDLQKYYENQFSTDTPQVTEPPQPISTPEIPVPEVSNAAPSTPAASSPNMTALATLARANSQVGDNRYSDFAPPAQSSAQAQAFTPPPAPAQQAPEQAQAAQAPEQALPQIKTPEDASKFVVGFKADFPDQIRDTLSDFTKEYGAGWANTEMGQALKAGDYARARELLPATAAKLEAEKEPIPREEIAEPPQQQQAPAPQPTKTDVAAATYANRQQQQPTQPVQAQFTPPAQAAPSQNQPAQQPAQQAAPARAAPPTKTEQAVTQFAQNVQRRGDPKELAAILANPRINPTVKSHILQSMEATKLQIQNQPDGTIVGIDPKSGAVKELYKGASKQTWGVVRKDMYGNEIHGFIDPAKKEVTEYQPPKSQNSETGATGTFPGATVEERLQNIPPEVRNTVKSMLDARQAPPSSFAMKGEYWQSMMRLAQQVDPEFDQAKWQTRVSEAKSLSSSGKAGQAISSANTLVNHLGGLDESIDKLGNTKYSWVNAPLQMVKGAAGDTEFQKARADFETKKKAVTDELVRLMRGSPGAASDIKSWSDTVDSAKSPAELHQATGSIIDLMRGRVEALTETHNRAFGKNEPPDSFLSKQARETINKIEERRAGTGETSKYGNVPTIQNKAGQKMILDPKTNQWVPVQ